MLVSFSTHPHSMAYIPPLQPACYALCPNRIIWALNSPLCKCVGRLGCRPEPYCDKSIQQAEMSVLRSDGLQRQMRMTFFRPSYVPRDWQRGTGKAEQRRIWSPGSALEPQKVPEPWRCRSDSTAILGCLSL
jgi:hypothetical protein